MTLSPGAIANIIAGQVVNLPTPQGGGGAGTSFGVIIYNLTAFVLSCLGPQGSSLLLPNTANLITGPGNSQGSVSVAAQVGANVPPGAVLGTIQTTWGSSAQDFAGSSYPQPLVPFQGGSYLMATALPGSTNNYTLIPPAGTGYLIVTALGAAGFTLTVVGVQSSTTYYSAGLAGGATGTVTVDPTKDYSYLVTAVGTAVRIDITAVPALPT